MAKCEYICLSAEEMERLKKECLAESKKPTKKPSTKKKTVEKPKSKAVAKPKATTKPINKKPAKKPRKPSTPKKRATSVKVSKKKKIVNKNRNTNSNVNNNNNVVSVNVRANPKAVSNIYIVRPAQQPVVEAPRRKKKRDIPYDAPFLPRRTPDGGLIQTASAPRQRTVYIQQSTPQPEIFVEEQSSGRSIGESSKKLLSAGAKAGRGIVSAGRNAVGRARNRRTRTEYEVDYPVTIDQAETVPALPSPSAKAEVLPANYELPKNTKKI